MYLFYLVYYPNKNNLLTFILSSLCLKKCNKAKCKLNDKCERERESPWQKSFNKTRSRFVMIFTSGSINTTPKYSSRNGNCFLLQYFNSWKCLPLKEIFHQDTVEHNNQFFLRYSTDICFWIWVAPVSLTYVYNSSGRDSKR